MIGEPLGIMVDRVLVIQKRFKREAYFDCTAALDGNFSTLFHAEPPSFASPASPVRPHSGHAMAGVVE